MKWINKLLKSEEGSVMLISAVLISTVFAGFAALVIDIGMLRVERRQLVATADAAALSAAQVLELNQGLGTDDARLAAEEAIRLNGYDALDAVIFIGNRQVMIQGAADTRQVVDVSISSSKELLFGKIFGEKYGNVSAKSTATWGYSKRVAGGGVLPFFVFESVFKTDTQANLHSGKLMLTNVDDIKVNSQIANGNWGWNNIFPEKELKEVIGGGNVGVILEFDAEIGTITGNKQGFAMEFNTRFDNAAMLTSVDDSRIYMSGLVPIINDSSKIESKGSKYVLPVKYFAMYEILDYIVADGIGSDRSFLFLKNGISSGETFNIDNYDVNYNRQRFQDSLPGVNYNDGELKMGTIVGRFVGQPIPYIAISNVGDQLSPVDKEIATYHKLIN